MVSATAEPDTICLEVEMTSNSLTKPRQIIGISSITIGSKKLAIRLNDDIENSPGTKEVQNANKNSCCISEATAKKLGQLGLQVCLLQLN